MRIREIKRKPWWKFWTVDQWQVRVELDSGVTQTVMIYDSSPLSGLGDDSRTFQDYVRNKVLHGTQWDFEVRERLGKSKDRDLGRLQSLVGRHIPESESEATIVSIPKWLFKEEG